QAIEAINRSYGATAPLVLTCRTREYVDAVGRSDGDVLEGAAVIEARAVSVAAAGRYLSRTGRPDRAERWRSLLAALDPEGPVMAALSSPLMITLARSVYAVGVADPAELRDAARCPDRAS